MRANNNENQKEGNQLRMGLYSAPNPRMVGFKTLFDWNLLLDSRLVSQTRTSVFMSENM
jgi:hypothetical protein